MTRPKRKAPRKQAIKATELNAQERLFVDEYLKDLNAKRAALEAGYSKTVSESKAYSWVSRGKEKPHVYAAVLKAMENRGRRLQVTQDRVLEELGRIAFADLRKLYREDGTIKAPHELDDDTAAAVAGVETLEEFGTERHSEPQPNGGELSRTRRTLTGFARKVKMHSKPEALRLAMQHLGMLREKLDVDLSGHITYQVDFGSAQG